ncbi:hypothetical protein [uncultured Veillonella sp.]|uniref:hypothetical protein n=1 Tax=uncultured Veillonella sp. TaxID=159268 RepID=UPI0025FCD73C|nr:hypothetical protein [uncultured Veillonella sp.]
MYYMFSNKDNLCSAVGNDPMQDMEGYTIIESDVEYPINRIILDGGTIKVLPDEEPREPPILEELPPEIIEEEEQDPIIAEILEAIAGINEILLTGGFEDDSL